MLSLQRLYRIHRQSLTQLLLCIRHYFTYLELDLQIDSKLSMSTNLEKNNEIVTGNNTAKYNSSSNNDSDVQEALGNIDELCSAIGVAYSIMQYKRGQYHYGILHERLLWVMNRLVEIQNCIHIIKSDYKNDSRNTYKKNKKEIVRNIEKFILYHAQNEISNEHINTLEVWIDKFTEQMPELTVFILPTGCELSSQLHFCRTVCRRAERNLISLVKSKSLNKSVQKYVNRLSDFLFTASRWVNYCEDQEEVQYKIVENDLLKNPERKRENSARKMRIKNE